LARILRTSPGDKLMSPLEYDLMVENCPELHLPQRFSFNNYALAEVSVDELYAYRSAQILSGESIYRMNLDLICKLRPEDPK